MSKIQLATLSNTTAVYSQPEKLKEKITGWIQFPDTYNDNAQSSFVGSINCYAMEVVDGIRSYVQSSAQGRSISIEKKRDSDFISLNQKPILIVKSLGSGAIGGLATAQIATLITAAMTVAACATPVGWVGGGGTAIVYFFFEKKAQKEKINLKYLHDIAQINSLVNKMLFSLEQRESNLRLNEANSNISGLSRINTDLNAQVATLSEDRNTALGQITALKETQSILEGHNTDLTNQLGAARNGIANLQASLTIANGSIESLNTNVTNSNGRLAAAQTRISGLDGNVAALRQENQNLRTSLTANQTNLTTTAAKVDELQRQSAANLASIRQMNLDLIAEMRADFKAREQKNAFEQEDRENRLIAKQIVERGIEKAVRREQTEKISKLNIDSTRKSAAFEVLQADHDQLANQIAQRFDVMTQTMSRNPTRSPVRELFRFNDRSDLLAAGSEDYGDFIEVEDGT